MTPFAAHIYNDAGRIASFTFVSDAVKAFRAIRCWVPVTHIIVAEEDWNNFLRWGGSEMIANRFIATKSNNQFRLEPI